MTRELTAAEIINAISSSELPVDYLSWGGDHFVPGMKREEEKGTYCEDDFDVPRPPAIPCGCPLTQLALYLRVSNRYDGQKVTSLTNAGFDRVDLLDFVTSFDILASWRGLENVRKNNVATCEDDNSKMFDVAVEVYNWCVENIPPSSRSF